MHRIGAEEGRAGKRGRGRGIQGNWSMGRKQAVERKSVETDDDEGYLLDAPWGVANEKASRGIG